MDQNEQIELTKTAFAKIGIKIEIDQDTVNKNLNPALLEVSKKLKQLTREAKLDDSGLFGKDFFANKVKDLTGFDTGLFKATRTMIGYGLASKDMNLDNKEFYKTLSPLEKGLVSIVSFLGKKKKVEGESTEETKKAAEAHGSLNKTLADVEGLEKSLNATKGLGEGTKALGKDSADAVANLKKIPGAAEEAEASVSAFQKAASFGLSAIVALLAAIGSTFYKMFMQVVTARDEVKKFDQLIGGMGQKGVTEFTHKLRVLNDSVWGLGYSLEKVNEVALGFVQAGVSVERSMSGPLTAGVLQLSGATGVAASEIQAVYAQLLKSTRIEVEQLNNMGNAFIQFNQYANKSGVLGQVSFRNFAEAITSSANALAIAATKGKAFTDSMTRDLMSLSGLATTLGLSISEINGMFENAGSMITSADSPFRAFLAISGGANINQMLTNQFNKTDAMLKGVEFLQNFNKSFGNNIQLTAQVAAQQLGISKEMAITMINTQQKTIDSMRKGQQELATIQTDATKKAFEDVNSDISSVWNRVKTMFVTLFQNVMGDSSGMKRLLRSVEDILGNFKNLMQSSGFLQRMANFVNNIANWLAGNAMDTVKKVGELIELISTDAGWYKIGKKIGSILWDVLKGPFLLLGQIIGFGLRMAFKGTFIGEMLGGADKAQGAYEALDKAETDRRKGDLFSEGGSGNSTLDQISRDRQKRLGEISSKRSELSQWSPDTVTYGKMADGKVGFMTVGQQETALEKEKKQLEKQMAEDISQMAADTHDVKMAICNPGASSSAPPPVIAHSSSPIAFTPPAGYEGYANGRIGRTPSPGAGGMGR